VKASQAPPEASAKTGSSLLMLCMNQPIVKSVQRNMQLQRPPALDDFVMNNDGFYGKPKQRPDSKEFDRIVYEIVDKPREEAKMK